MSEITKEIEMLFKKMLEDVHLLIEQKEGILINDLKDYNMKIQWIINNLKGYQVFENGNYSYELGGELNDADLTLEFVDDDLTLNFFRDKI